MPDGSLDEEHALDSDRLRVCTEAIELMTAGHKLEEVEFRAGAVRSACEVVAYYELEEFVAAAEATEPRQDPAQGRDPRAE